MVRPALALVFLALGASPAMGAVSASIQGTALTITGDAADNTVGVMPNGTGVAVDTTGDGVADASFDGSTFDHTVIDLGAGNDVLQLGNGLSTFGIFTVDGGPGNDVLIGGDGTDVIHGGDGADVISGGRGSDALFGDAGDDTFSWAPGDGSDTLEGGDGSDRFVMTGSNTNEHYAVEANGTRVRITRDIASIVQDVAGVETIDIRMLAGDDVYAGGSGLSGLVSAIVVDGGPGADTLTGGDANETLSGGADADTVSGGSGDDTFPVSPQAPIESVDGGPGEDTIAVTGTDASDVFSIDSPGPGQAVVSQPLLSNLAFAAGTAIERVSVDAGAGNDVVTPTPAAVSALSFDLSGGPGDDILTGGQLPDTLRGGDGNDTLHGGDGNDQLFGDAGDDALFGEGGSDQFHCAGPTDTLDATAQDTVDPDCIAPLPPPPPPPADTTPPKLTIKSVPKRITRHVLLARGIALAVSANEPAALDISLLGRVRRGAVLAAVPNLTLVHRTIGLSQGQHSMRLRPSKRLVGRSRRFTVTVQIVASDAAGNRSTYTRTVSVR